MPEINLPYLKISSNVNADLKHEIQRIRPDKIAILVDENTEEHCLPKLDIQPDKIIKIQSGEPHKTLLTCEHIWKELTDLSCTRKSLLINLGGGVIGDMGGFCAATFKRGIAFINLPTTLLSQVDASIGGKLGVDFHGLKNHIGLFRDPDAVIVSPDFLTTLHPRDLRSGYAEIIKHALIYDSAQWDHLTSRSYDELDWDEIIPRSIAIKNDVVQKDPFEGGLRKILNYGHTIGHAVETLSLSSEEPLLHGEAIAIGMILENKLAVSLNILSKETASKVDEYIESIFGRPEHLPSVDDMNNLLLQDKKNDHEGIKMSLINQIGQCQYDVLVTKEQLTSTLDK